MENTSSREPIQAPDSTQRVKKYCLFCDNDKHSLNNCSNFKLLGPTQKHTWIKTNNRCWRCGRGHRAAECHLKMACKTCNSRHLLVLHDKNEKAQEKTEKGEWRFQTSKMVPSKTSVLNITEEILYIDRPPEGRKVLLKVCKVILRNGTRTVETFAISDDGSESTILLHPAAQQLGLQGETEYLPIRTIRQEPQVLQGAMVSLTIASAAEPHRVFQIKGAFTAKQLGLAEHTQPVETLQQRYRHLKDLPLLPFKDTEKRLGRDPDQAAAYIAEIQRLEEAGCVVKLEPSSELTPISWYIPHHMVQHNGKNRVVFNCSFQFRSDSLNQCLLPGLTLGPSLLAVLLRFREHSMDISSDIRGMFKQVRVLPEDRPLLRFPWRNLQRDKPPALYEWRVLPFGTTSSPCCATYALQKHIMDNSQPGETIREAILKGFYVDNCLLSLTFEEEVRALVDQLRQALAEGGFELRQWASNRPTVISHLPSEVWCRAVDRTGPAQHLSLDCIGTASLTPSPTSTVLLATQRPPYVQYTESSLANMTHLGFWYHTLPAPKLWCSCYGIRSKTGTTHPCCRNYSIGRRSGRTNSAP